MPHLLYEAAVPNTNSAFGEWQQHVVTLPEGHFRVRFVFTMGYPFESAAGVDTVQLVPCAESDGVMQGLPLTGNVNLGPVPDSKVHGAKMGPIWGRQDPGGPHVGLMKLLSGCLTKT